MKIKVLSYNIHKGYSLANVSFVLKNIKKLLNSTGADVVFLQEIISDQKKSDLKTHWPTANQLEFLADTIWKFYAYGQNVATARKAYGNGILSGFPVLSEENINLTIVQREKRGLQHVEIVNPKNNKKLHLLNVHLDLFEKSRVLQIKKIIERVESHIPEGEPIILAGDFNDWNQSLTPFLEELGFKEAFMESHGEHAKTFPSLKPTLKLDRMYYKNIKLVSAEVVDASSWHKLSDHLPIMCEFKW